MEYKIYDCKTYKIHTIKTDKFKTCSLEIIFKNKLEKERITELNMLADILNQSSKEYSSKRELYIALEKLYSASTRNVVTRLGNSYLFSVITDFLNPKYCEEGYLEDILAFPFKLITEPNINDNEFDLNSFKIVKNRLANDIKSLKENATKFAFRRSLEIMDKNSVTSCSMLGSLKDLEKITPSSLVDTYNYVFNNSFCDIYLIGNLDMDKCVNLIKNNFKGKMVKKEKLNLFVENKINSSVNDVCENGNYKQDSLVMIYNLDKLTKRERDYVIRIYNIILGSGGLTSKLDRYIREENSLCYNVSSMYQKYDQLLMVYAGISYKNKDLTVSLVNKAIKEMQDGKFSKDDINNAVKMVISSLKMSEDSLSGIINNYLFNDLDNLDMYEERIKTFGTVSKDEIIALSKKIKLNTIYLLKGGESK